MLRGAVGLLGALCLFGCASTAAPDLELSLPDPDPGAAAVREIAAWGDSMTADADTVAGYPKYLAELLERPVYNGGVVGEQSFAIYYRFLAATDRRSDLSIFWMGRNNYQALGDGTVMADIAAAVANLRGQKHFLVVSICNGDIADEYVGAAHYRWLTALNDSLRTRYASNFVDIRDSLIAHGSASDSLDRRHEVVPTSMRRDALHLNTAGARVVAQAIASIVQARGW